MITLDHLESSTTTTDFDPLESSTTTTDVDPEATLGGVDMQYTRKQLRLVNNFHDIG
jgi:hypothetical protein